MDNQTPQEWRRAYFRDKQSGSNAMVVSEAACAPKQFGVTAKEAIAAFKGLGKV